MMTSLEGVGNQRLLPISSPLRTNSHQDEIGEGHENPICEQIFSFCKDHDRGGKLDLSKGYWNLKSKNVGNHAFLRDN